MAGKNIGSNSIKNIKIKKASTQVFVVVAVASVVLSMSLVAISLLWGNLKYNNQVHSAQEAARDQLEVNLDTVAELDEKINALNSGGDLLPDQPADKRNSEVILDALPSKFDYPGFTTAMYNFAKLYSVELSSFSADTIEEVALEKSSNPEPESIPFTMQVGGTYSEINNFLKGVTDNIQPLKVTNMRISGEDDELIVVLNIETSYQPAYDITLEKKVIE